jgi:hypothetical protein
MVMLRALWNLRFINPRIFDLRMLRIYESIKFDPDYVHGLIRLCQK